MPKTTVEFFKDTNGTEPFREWLDQQHPRVQEKAFRSLKNLEDVGYELRRPIADYLRDGIYELRFRYLKTNYRILYFFFGQQIAVVSHGLKKERQVPSDEIDIARERKAKYYRGVNDHANARSSEWLKKST